MGTGGTLPTNITQSVRLYNTTGIIEKEKGIYFCPFLSTSGTPLQVRSRWLSAFNTVASSDTNYQDITISQWSPEDRVLTIKGTPDDFRCVTEEGSCLNYLILTRNVTRNNVTNTFFYGFFITDAQQVGKGSVRLTLQTDDFTNVFYLHNKKLISAYSGSYVDVFNEKLKNCYVARQHYNRVKETAKPLSYEDNDVGYKGDPTVIDIDLYSEISDLSNYKGKLDITNISLRDVSHHFDITDDITKQELMLTENGYVLHLELDYYFQDEQLSINLQLQSYYAEEDNLPIFSQIEEGFKYKRQYRDYKEFINYGEPVTQAEKTAYANANSWSDLTSALKKKALKLSTSFVHLVFKSSKVILRPNRDATNRTIYDLKNSPLPSIYNSTESLYTLVFPIFNPPSYLKKFSKVCSNTYPLFLEDEDGNIIFDQGVGLNIERLIGELSPYSEYIVGAYISKESTLINSMVFEDDYVRIRCLVETGSENYNYKEIGNLGIIRCLGVPRLEKGVEYDTEDLTNVINGLVYTHIFQHQEQDENWELNLAWETPAHTPDMDLCIAFLENVNQEIKFNLNLYDSVVDKDLKTEYYDTTLTFNPYSFYTVSYLGRIESPLNKLNYYEYPIIECNLTIRCSDVFKYNFTPTYTIGGLKQKFYSEAIEQTLTNNLTILSSSLAEYLIANQTQMKNQYAINDLNHEYGLVTTAVSGIGNVVGGAMRGALVGGSELAGAGAVAGAVQTVTGLVNEGIDWDKDTKQIAMNQKAKLSDMGNLPSNLKQVGTDIVVDLSLNEIGLYLNHYTIDELSYNSICKYLERFGYMVNIYDELHVNTRVGWDFIQLQSFDYEAEITEEQEQNIRQIFKNGVTLLHNKTYMTSGHNYEVILG